MLNYLGLCKTGFYTYALMNTKADTFGKFPISRVGAGEYIACEHWADVASVWPYLDSGLSSCKVLRTLT